MVVVVVVVVVVRWESVRKGDLKSAVGFHTAGCFTYDKSDF